MLTPHAEDPNRRQQLEVRKQNPDKFGAGHKNLVDKKVDAQKIKK